MGAARYQIRPLGMWGRPDTKDRASSGRFRASWTSTLELLCREVDLLGGQVIAVQIDVEPGDLRRDGMLRAGTKVGFPGVKISFDSRHGPLTYATDAYDDRRYSGDPPGWQANVRAIALALEALRAVDRYGVSGSGEQYRGWTAITGTPVELRMTAQEAAVLLSAGDHTTLAAHDLLGDRAAVEAVYRQAVKIYHPDVRGGDAELFRRLTAARDLLLTREGNS